VYFTPEKKKKGEETGKVSSVNVTFLKGESPVGGRGGTLR